MSLVRNIGIGKCIYDFRRMNLPQIATPEQLESALSILKTIGMVPTHEEIMIYIKSINDRYGVMDDSYELHLCNGYQKKRLVLMSYRMFGGRRDTTVATFEGNVVWVHQSFERLAQRLVATGCYKILNTSYADGFYMVYIE